MKKRVFITQDLTEVPSEFLHFLMCEVFVKIVSFYLTIFLVLWIHRKNGHRIFCIRIKVNIGLTVRIRRNLKIKLIVLAKKLTLLKF